MLSAPLKRGSSLAHTHWHNLNTSQMLHKQQWRFCLHPGLEVEVKHWNR